MQTKSGDLRDSIELEFAPSPHVSHFFSSGEIFEFLEIGQAGTDRRKSKIDATGRILGFGRG